MDSKDNQNQENRKLDSKMKEEDLNNDSSEMRAPQDLTGLAAQHFQRQPTIECAFDQNRNQHS